MPYPYFRDFAIFESYARLDRFGIQSFDWGYLEMLFYRADPTPGKWLVWVYLFLWLVISYWFNCRAWSKLIGVKLSQWSVTIAVGLYFINFWTIERVLMGHINVLKGHILLVPILVTLQKEFRYSLIIKPLLLLWLGMVSPHYLGFLVIIWVLLKFPDRGIQLPLPSNVSFLRMGESKNVKVVLNLALKYFSNFRIFVKRRMIVKNNGRILKAFEPLLWFIPVIIWQVAKIYSDKNLGLQLDSLINSANKRSVLEAMSPHILETQDLVTRVLIGSASWNTSTFSEFNSIGRSWLDLGYWWYSDNWANWILILIFGLLLLFNAKKYSQWILLLFFSMIASFGLSGSIFDSWNWFIAQLPLMNLYRESGKFYGLVIFCLTLIWLKMVQKDSRIRRNDIWYRITNILYAVSSLILVLNIWAGVNILSRVNMITYPQFDKDISQYCNDNPRLKKGVFLPNNIYIQTEYANGIFGPNHYYLSSQCPFIQPQNSQVAGKSQIGYLIQDPENQLWRSLITALYNNPEVCQDVDWWLKFYTWSRQYDFWAWDSSYYQDLDQLSACLKTHGLHPVITSKNLEFYTNFSNTGSTKL